MPNYTTKLNLEKPLGNEFYNIEVHNSNTDKIDAFANEIELRKLNKAGDIMTGGLTAAALTITNGTNETNITARYNNLATDTMSIYNNATNTGIYNNMPTHGNISIFSRSKSTGVVSYAGGNYGTINGSTATFSGNVTAPSITIGEYVVTIV